MPERATPTREPRPTPEKVSNQIERWLASDGDKTLGGLIDVFQEKSFALIFILLLGLPALPLPTGGATHVFELIAMLLALEDGFRLHRLIDPDTTPAESFVRAVGELQRLIGVARPRRA